MAMGWEKATPLGPGFPEGGDVVRGAGSERRKQDWTLCFREAEKMRPVRDKGRPVFIAKRWLGVWLGCKPDIAHSGGQRRTPRASVQRKTWEGPGQRSTVDGDQHRCDVQRLRRAITDERRNLAGDKKKARVGENKYEQSTDRIWKGLREGRSAVTELRGGAGGLRRWPA